MTGTTEGNRYRPKDMDSRLIGLHITVGWVHDGVRLTMTGKLDTLTYKRTIEGEHDAEGVAVMVRLVPAGSRPAPSTMSRPEMAVAWWRPAVEADLWDEGDFTPEAVPA